MRCVQHMDPSDIKFPLVTGMDMSEPSLTDNDIVRLQAITVTFIEDAMKTAAELATARGSDVVTTADVLMGLKLTAMPYDGRTYWDRHPDWQTRMSDHEDALMRDESSGSDSDEVADAPDPVEDAITNAIASASYAVMDTSDLDARWEAWRPTGMDLILRNAVQNTIAHFDAAA